MDLEDLYQRGLSLEKLRAFLAVVRAGTITAAAGGENSRRSLISRQIGELEKTLGLELFLRKGKTLHLTETGRELALLTAGFFSEFGDFVERRLGNKSVLRIGTGASVLEALVFPSINEIRKRLPDFQFEFITNTTEGILRSLHQGEVDLGIVRSGYKDANLTTTFFGQMDFVLVGRMDFDRNLPRWGLLQFLQRVPLAIIRGDGHLVQQFHQICTNLEVEPRILAKADSFGQVKQLIRSGIPGGLLPQQLVTDLASSTFHTVKDPELVQLTRNLDLVTDSRVAKLSDRLPIITKRLSELFETYKTQAR